MTATLKKTCNSRQASNGSKQTSFLPEPDFTPKLPSKNTLVSQALSLMLEGRVISHLDFQGETDSYRLAAYIHLLIKMSWPIQIEDVPFTAQKKPNNRFIRRYFLDKKIIARAKKIFGGVVW
jgi:hypothetical protein